MWILLVVAVVLILLIVFWKPSRPRARHAATVPGELLNPLPIYFLTNIISEEENQHLVKLAEPKFRPSLVEDGSVSPARTSSSAYLKDDPVLNRIKQRLAEICNYPIKNFEPIQVVQYTPQQQYKPHLDVLRSSPYARHVTFFIYLDDSDGVTEFPNLGVSIKPKRNCAAMWYNVDEQGYPDDRTLHAGRPPTVLKRGVNVWVRGE